MKKYGKFFKKAALTAAICLGLSQSVWAMPSGGAAVDPASVTIDSGTLNDPSSGATIATVGGPAIINWQAFGIANGESLTFNTDMGALLNRVTGGNVSEIYGTLAQIGDKPMFLVNPAGIVVGSTGVIDANTLTLSTLAMSDDQFALAANGIVEFGDGSNPGPLTIEKGAELNVNNMLAALGGTVEVADGVTFSVGNDLVLTAAKNVTALVDDAAKGHDYTIGTENFYPIGISATSENKLSVGKDTIKTSDLAFLAGGKVDITGANIESDSVDVLSATSGQTRESIQVQNSADIVFKVDADNAITVADATLKGDKDLNVIGGKVNIEGSTLTQSASKSSADLDLVALGEYTVFEGGDASNQPLDANHTLTLKDTTVEFNGQTQQNDKYIFMGAGQVALDNTQVTSNNGIRIASGKDFGREGGTADEKNTLTIANGSNVDADTWMEVMGGSIAVTDSGMSAGKDLHMAAFKTATLSAAEKGNGGTNEGGAVTGGTAGVGNTVALTGANIDAQSIQIFGGKVDITDKSAITETNTANKNDLTIMAAPGFISPEGEDGINPDFAALYAGEPKEYAITVKDSSVTLNTSGSTGDPSIDIGAGAVTLDKATITLTGGDDNGIHVFAISGANGTDDNQVMTATTDNVITLKNGAKVESKGERLAFAGGKIVLSDGSTITKESTNKNKSGLFLVANDKIGWDNEGGIYSTAYPVAVPTGAKTEFTASTDSKILLNGSDVTKDYAEISGGNVEPQPVANTDLPTGGKLASGSVSVNGAMFTAGDLENESVVTVDPVNNGRQHAIINWNTFNIGTGKSLTFEMLGGPLLNRVTGGNLSSIYGTLTQRGDHPMFLVNPNGILVGKGATIDANQLVLSTLAISDATFQKDTLNDNCVLTTPTGRETPAAIQFKDGAKVSVDCFLKAFGGSVEADGVSITGKTDVKGNDADIHLLAANTVNGKIKLNSVQDMSAVADKNTISVSGSTVDSKGRVYLQGGNFAISDKSDIRGKGIYLRSAEQYVSGGSQTSASQDSANTTVTIKDSKIRATKDADGVDGSIGNSFIVGGKVSIEDSTINSIENYRGFQGWTYGENDYPTYTTGLANTVSVKGGALFSRRYVRLQGGQVSVDGSNIASNRIQIWAESSYAGPENSMQHIDGSGVTHLTRESGNQVTLTDSSLGVGYNINEVNILGWNANITGSGIEARNVDITAANGWKRASSDGVRTDDYTADGTNAVAISDSTLTSTEGNVHVVAGKVSVDKSELDAARYAQLWIAKGLHLSTEGDKSVKAYEATADNAVSITNSTIASGEGYRSSILGGKLEIKDNSTVTGSEVTLQALKSYALNGSSDNEDSGQSMTATADKNTVTISDSKVDAQGRVSLQGGDFNISGSDIRGKEVYLRSAENYLKGSSQDSANTAVTIKDSVIHARKDMDAVDGSVGNSFIVGGKVSIEDSEIHSIENYRGFKGWTYGENDYPTYSTGLANTVSVKNSELLSKRYVRLQGGQVSVDGGEIRSPRVQLWAESSYTGPGNSMHHIDGSGVTHLTRESGNQVTFTNSYAGSVGEFNVLGWNANITGSQVNAANVDITAVNGWKRSSSDGVRTDDYTADGTNAVAISDSKLTSTEGNVHVVAGSVSVDKSELDAARYAQLWIAKGLHLSTEGERSVKSYEADTDNAIAIANSTIHSGEGSRSSILGGKLDIKDNSTVTGSEVTLRASKSYILDGASDNEDATLTLKDSKVDADKKLFAISGKVDVDGSDLHAKEQLQLIASETNPVYKAGKANTMKIRNGSTLASEGDVTVFGGDVTMSGKSTASAGENLFFAGGTEMTMKNNVPTLTGVKETTRVSKDSTLLQGGVDVTDQFATTRAIVPETIPEEVADSYIEGMDKMAEVLEPNTTPAERQNATQKVVQEINNNSGSNLEKAAAVSGMMQAILLDDNISDSEKVALQKEIIQTFEPTKQVISEANNTVTSATQQASDAQPQQTQQQSAAVNTNAATAIPTAAEVNESPVNMGSTEE